MANKRLAKKQAKRRAQTTATAALQPTAPALTKEIAKKEPEVKREAPEKEEKAEDKKAAAKKGRTLKVNVCLQYQGKQVEEQEIIAKIKAWWKEQGNMIKDLDTLDIYMKPEDGKAYFKINGTISGSIDLF